MIVYNFRHLATTVPHDIKERFRNESVAKQYYTSRYALKDCLEQYGLESKTFDIEIVNNHYLKEHPEIVVSLSHTNTACIATISKKGIYKSIGIDLEHIDREIKAGTTRMFINDFDTEEAQKSLLETWVKKEAAFKALSPLVRDYTEKEVLVLKDIWINEDTFGLTSSDSKIGNLQNISNDNYCIWVATIMV